MKTIQEIKKELNLNDEKIAEIFGFKNRNSYATSSAKKRYENAVVRLYDLINKSLTKQ
ncbi:hypothetical protein QP519_10750 [Weeksella virosa]|uniref:hypothetical protein n=1 Tax=Weeksella virosa TaxID=1014 RepID=UPI0025552273|nr:hypothetical protein [Weeksella virosa]MDK7376013.1 hypothetical protein [Weeksella virosa]